MPKIRILNGHHGMTSEKSARRMVERGIARWNDSHTAIRLIEQDFRVKPSTQRATYSAGFLGLATVHEMKGIPVVMAQRLFVEGTTETKRTLGRNGSVKRFAVDSEGKAELVVDYGVSRRLNKAG